MVYNSGTQPFQLPGIRFMERGFSSELQGCVVLHSAYILHVHGWDFVHLCGLVSGTPWLSASLQHGVLED